MSDLTTAGWWSNKWEEETSKNRYRFTRGEKEWDRFLTNMLEDVPHSGQLLELGCAPGTMIQRMALLRPDIFINGVDFSEVGIQKTHQVYNKMMIKGELYLQDIRLALPSLFDVVCSYGLIEHFDNPRDIIVSHVNHTKPGGKVILTVPNFAAPPVNWALKHFASDTLKSHNVRVMRKEALEKLLIDAGLTGVRSGEFGGCSFPTGTPNNSVSGQTYRYFTYIWSGVLSLTNLMLPVTKFSPWQSHIWCIGRKNA